MLSSAFSYMFSKLKNKICVTIILAGKKRGVYQQIGAPLMDKPAGFHLARAKAANSRGALDFSKNEESILFISLPAIIVVGLHDVKTEILPTPFTPPMQAKVVVTVDVCQYSKSTDTTDHYIAVVEHEIKVDS